MEWHPFIALPFWGALSPFICTSRNTSDSCVQSSGSAPWPAKFIKKVDPEQAKELNQKIAHNYLMYSDWYK
jgi:hypothetical protein